MANITKDQRKVNKAQDLYDKGSEHYLNMIEMISKDIPEICDILHGVAMGKKGDKYKVSKERVASLKDQLNIWKANVQNPEKILAHIDNGLKKAYKKGQSKGGSNSKPSQPKLAVFSPKA